MVRLNNSNGRDQFHRWEWYRQVVPSQTAKNKGGRSNRPPLKGTGIANDSKRSSIACPASSEVFDPCRAMDRGLRCDSPDARTLRSYLRDDQHRRPRRVHGLVGLRPSHVRGLAVSDDALRPPKLCASSLRRRHAFACVSAFVARDRPSVANQSRRQGTTGILVTTGPASSSWRGRAPLLRFRVPFSTHRPRRALVPKAAGLRTCPAPAFCARRSPALHRPRTCDGDRFALAVFRFIGEACAASPDPVDALRSSPAIPHSATSLACDAR